MEEKEEWSDLDFFTSNTPPPPPRVSLSPSSAHLPLRLSSSFSQPGQPVAAARKLAWVSLQGRIVGAAEATSARSIGGGLGLEEAVAWEMFSPMHRVVVVAAVAAATAESKKCREIARLQRSVEIRDQLLLFMQQKLEALCEQTSPMKDHSGIKGGNFCVADDYMDKGMFKRRESDLCNTRICEFELQSEDVVASYEMNPSDGLKDVPLVESGRNEIFKIPQLMTVEQEERRMSDLSDMFSSAASSVDIQMSVLAAEQDCYNLRRECEEKDATIKELSATIHASNIAESKRILELEDVIKRKNLVIAKLRKDMLFLEQKVIQLTRLRRPSFSTNLNSRNMQLPTMTNNILYDMSTSSPSSSDSDCSEKNKKDHCRHPLMLEKHSQEEDISMESQESFSTKDHTSSLISLHRSTESPRKQRSVSPLKENRAANRSDSTKMLRSEKIVSSIGGSRTKGRDYRESKNRASEKRWV